MRLDPADADLDPAVRHCLCLVCSTAFVAKTVPFFAALRQQQHGRRHSLTTTDEDGVRYCLADIHGTGDVGSWRGVPCSDATIATFAMVANSSGRTTLAATTGGHLTLDNAEFASGPVAHTRYLTADRAHAPASSWTLRGKAGRANTFEVVAAPAAEGFVRDDDKMGGARTDSAAATGEWCLDLAPDFDNEVWAGPLADKKVAVALLNRSPLAPATLTVDWPMFNGTAAASYNVKNVWTGKTSHCLRVSSSLLFSSSLLLFFSSSYLPSLLFSPLPHSSLFTHPSLLNHSSLLTPHSSLLLQVRQRIKRGRRLQQTLTQPAHLQASLRARTPASTLRPFRRGRSPTSFSPRPKTSAAAWSVLTGAAQLARRGCTCCTRLVSSTENVRVVVLSHANVTHCQATRHFRRAVL